ERHDVRMAQACSQLNLAPEAVEIDIWSQVRRQDLEHDLAIQGQVASEEHSAHPTTELSGKVVGAAQGPGELLLEVGGQSALSVGEGVKNTRPAGARPA